MFTIQYTNDDGGRAVVMATARFTRIHKIFDVYNTMCRCCVCTKNLHLEYYWYVRIRDQDIAARIGPDWQGHLSMWWELQLAHVACRIIVIFYRIIHFFMVNNHVIFKTPKHITKTRPQYGKCVHFGSWE